MKYFLIVRDEPPYRAFALREGFRRLGYYPGSVADCDVVVTWNRYAGRNEDCEKVERRGGQIIVMENGYMGRDAIGGPWYALARNQHNGAGRWPIARPGGWRAQGWPLLPYRVGGGSPLVLPQRGIGPSGVAMPKNWLQRTESILKGWGVQYRVRHHPGERPPRIPLEEDIAEARFVVTWGSGAAIKALAAGVPVVSDFPKWIARAAATPLTTEGVVHLNLDEKVRETTLNRVASAQWKLSDIQSGEALSALLQGEVA